MISFTKSDVALWATNLSSLNGSKEYKNLSQNSMLQLRCFILKQEN